MSLFPLIFPTYQLTNDVCCVKDKKLMTEYRGGWIVMWSRGL